jgi:hypothetical protein
MNAKSEMFARWNECHHERTFGFKAADDRFIRGDSSHSRVTESFRLSPNRPPGFRYSPFDASAGSAISSELGF